LSNDDPALVWRRSRCDNGNCVEVAQVATGVALRDSTRPEGPMLRFTPQDWQRFLTDLRAGQLFFS